MRLRIGRESGAEIEGEIDEGHRGRSYALLPTPGMLLLGVAEDRGAPEGCAPILAGNLSRVAFPEVVSLIAQGRISGVLRVYGSSASRSIAFRDGEVCGASSQRVGERLGEIAVRMGLIKRADMDSLEREAGDARAAARLAVERGLLTERALWNALQEHVTTIFQALLLETRGTFVLTDERIEESRAVPGLSAEGLLMEGVRRLDELRALRSGKTSASEPARVLAAFNTAFRDIFATAEDAGAGEALRLASNSVFDEDPAGELFRGLRFDADGELSADEALPMLEARLFGEDCEPGELLSDVLSTVMLFLLFVAGEHLEPAVHQALHSRAKAHVGS